MIKKLKMRFVLVNMLILTFVLLATLSSIYIMMSNSEIKVSNEIMDTLIENHKKAVPYNKKIRVPYGSDKKSDFNRNSAPDYTASENAEQLVWNESGGLKLVRLSNIDPTENEIQQSENGESQSWGNPWENPWFNPWQYNPWDPNNNPWLNPWENSGQNPWENGNPWGDNNQWGDNNPWGNDNPWGNGKPWEDGNQWEKPWDKPTQKPEDQPSLPPDENPSVTEVPPSETPAVTEAPPVADTPPVQPSPPAAAPEPPSQNSPDSVIPEDGIADTTENNTQEPPATKKPSEKPENLPPPEITTRYNGNLVRSHIIADIGQNGEVLDLSLQYFFRYEDEAEEDEAEYNEQVRSTIRSIISSEQQSGKCRIETVSYRYKLSSAGAHNEKTLILLDRSIEISTLHRLKITFIFIGCAGLVVVFFFSLFLASWAIKPIEIAWNRQKQFIADASHELKTPLTVIATNTDVVLSTPNDYIRNQERWLRYIKSETARMSKLVSELLYIAKSDSNEIKMDMTDFDISNTISGICLNFETLAYEADRELVADISPRLKYFGDEDRIKQLFTILIDNSIKYSIVGSQISVSLFRNNQGRIKFCISNKCENLTEENISKLFDRFYRVDSSRNSGTGGTGLGLNIAQTIAEAHNGIINVNYNYGIISFTVTL